MKKWFLNIEFSLVGLVIIGMGLRLLHLPFADLILMVALLTLSFIYLFLGLSANNEIDKSISPFLNETPFLKVESLTLLIAGIAISAMLVGILFEILHWEGGKYMITIGGISSLIAMIGVYFLLRINQTVVYNFIFFRQLPITFMAGAMLYLGDRLNL